MRKKILITLAFSWAVSYLSFGQDLFKDINIQTLSGIELPLNSVLKNKADKPTILFTWSKEWCWPCVEALNKFDVYYYEELRDDFALKFIALNLDKDTSNDEIKEFTIENEWYFDIYQDPEGNFMSALNVSSAPETYLIINNKVIEYKKGFIDKISNPEPNADYIYNMIKSIGSNTIYYDEDWDYTGKENATYLRYVDHFDDIYEVRDRWISGELQMRGQYSDKWQTTREGKFIWYHQNGKESTIRNYVNNVQQGFSSQWYESGQLWVKEEYSNGRLYNILELYAPNGMTLPMGRFSNGDGYIYRYDSEGNKVSKQEYMGGQWHGNYIVYNSDGSVGDEYIYDYGKFVRKDE